MNKLITLTGPSGSGKSTIEKILVDKYGYRKAISHTSRQIRKNEHNGIDYYFVTKEIMQTMYDANVLAEYTEYNGNYYGVTIEELEKSQVIVIEPHGLEQVKIRMKNTNTEVISVYLDIDTDTQINRMKLRGDKEEDIQRRVNEDKVRFAPDSKLYDIIFKTNNNPNFNTAVANFITNVQDKDTFIICNNLLNVLKDDEPNEQNN